MLDMKRVEKMPASCVADPFHLSQRDSEGKTTALFVEALTSTCLHGGTRLRPSPTPPHLSCQPGCPSQDLGAPHNWPCQFVSTGSDACDGDQTPAACPGLCLCWEGEGEGAGTSEKGLSCNWLQVRNA